jgi:helicase SWR1
MAWFNQRAQRTAAEEGTLRRRILEEAKPGGKLSKEHLSIYQDADPQREPTRQFGHSDHLVAHVLHLRHLQQREKTQHRQLAKKVAHEALEFWKAKRGPTEEDLREEADRMFHLIYKQVVFDVKAKWEMVGNYVQQRKLEAWRRDEEIRRQIRLKEKLERSEHMFAKLRGEVTSSWDEDRDSGDESEEDGSETSEEENMSESSSEDDGQEEEEGGDMDEDDLKAYLEQRKAEPPDITEDEDQEEREGHEDQDVSVAELLHPNAEADDDGQSEDMQDVSMTDLFGEDTQTAAIDGVDQDPEPPANDGNTVELDEVPFSSDESTDMDSTDYDSDEDMSSTGEEDNAEVDDEEEGEADDDTGSGDEKPIPKNSLLSLFKDVVKPFDGLPTPTTSAEGDDREKEAVAEEHGAEAEVQAAAAAMVDEVVEDVVDVKLDDATTKQDEDVEPTYDPEATTAPAGQLGEPDLAAADGKELVPQPALLRGTLRSYQHAGLDWLASLYRNGTNGILADEMGLGKTIQTIALLGHLAEVHEIWETHLVIVPTSVVLNWVTEFQKFLPGFRVLGYYGTADERQAKRRGWVNDPHHENKEKRGYNVVITSYNVAMQDINAIRNVPWHYLVLDEAHNIRNFNSQRWQVLIRLKTRARLLLTGTPLQNSLTELWSLLTFLTAGDDDPQHGDLEEFLSHWKEPVKEIFDRGVQTLSSEAQKVVDNLHISLRPFLLRRLKSEVEKDLPKKTESVVVCKLSKRQRQLYQEYMGLAETRRSLTQGNAVSAGKVLLSLRRVCNHPDLFDPRPIQTSFAMETSVAETFSSVESVVRRLLGVQDDISGGLVVVNNEGRRKYTSRRAGQLSANARLEKEFKEEEAAIKSTSTSDPDASTIAGSQALQKLRLRRQKLDQLRSSIQISNASFQAVPIYGSDLREIVTVKTGRAYRIVTKDIRGRVLARPLRGWPSLGQCQLRFETDHVSDWLLSKTSRLQESVQTTQKYAEQLHETVVRFAFCTPAATAPVLDYALPPRAQQVIRASTNYPLEADYAHEARTHSAIAFPDSRLLIYDSGKLQRLTRLLRDLQSRGSRSLIFTQMTGTLNILEQFLNLLNLPYLRLDGSTPVERRQLYSAEFNRPDSKFQCMILSSRAGGIGLNLTGASSVIFYDLDWNPQMDRQCMDRAHRIGQVRDVEVYKMVSEKTVEENILRRAEQKSLLDQTVIQEGHFTTEYQQQRRTSHHSDDEDEDDVAAAIERFLGGVGNEKATTQAIESVEDKEDVQAAQQARKEEVHADDADFAADRSSKGPSVPPTPGHVTGDEEDEERNNHVDKYMIKFMERLLKDAPFVPPQVRKTDRHGRDPSHRKRKR